MGLLVEHPGCLKSPDTNPNLIKTEPQHHGFNERPLNAIVGNEHIQLQNHKTLFTYHFQTVVIHLLSKRFS